MMVAFPHSTDPSWGVLFLPSELVLSGGVGCFPPGGGCFPSLDRSFLGVLFLPSARLVLPGRGPSWVLFLLSAQLVLPGDGCFPSLDRFILGVSSCCPLNWFFQVMVSVPHSTGPSWRCSSCCPLDWLFQVIVAFPHPTDPFLGFALLAVSSTGSSTAWLLSLTRQVHPGSALLAVRSTGSSR